MAAPTSAANVKNPCQLGAVHTWHIVDLKGRAEHACSARGHRHQLVRRPWESAWRCSDPSSKSLNSPEFPDRTKESCEMVCNVGALALGANCESEGETSRQPYFGAVSRHFLRKIQGTPRSGGPNWRYRRL